MSDRIGRQTNAKKSNKDTNNCGKCWQTLSDSDEYCRYCGTKRGEGDFNPADNIMECIYGPPPKEYAFACKSCGHAWTQKMMMPRSVVACPKCGLRAITIHG